MLLRCDVPFHDAFGARSVSAGEQAVDSELVKEHGSLCAHQASFLIRQEVLHRSEVSDPLVQDGPEA